MPGGWTISMAWMRMPGQTWPGFAASFLGMWIVMMVAMMLPSLSPMLGRYRQAAGRTGETPPGPLTALVGVGYFFVWTVFGMAAFPLGAALAAAEMRQPALAGAVPIMVSEVVLVAGVFQFSGWKARHLAWCRKSPGLGDTLPADAGTAWRHGLRLGLHCTRCCAGLMAILLIIGVMDLRAMAVVAAVITAERLVPAGERVARAIGAVVVGAGLFLIARAVGFGRRIRIVHLSFTVWSDGPRISPGGSWTVRLVECRFFGGLTEEEIAEVLAGTVRTVQRDWAKARMLLRRALEP